MNLKIESNKAPKAIGPYSQAIKTDNGFLYVSGSLGFNPETGLFEADDIKVQTRQSLENMKAILEEAGYSFKDVVKTTVLLKDINEFGAMNEIYNEYFSDPYPARIAFEVGALPKNGRVEIEAVAYKD